MSKTMTKIGSDSDFRDSFLEGAARAFFVSAYASYIGEGHSMDNDLTDEDREERLALPRPRDMGESWEDYAPATPIAAYALAGEMWREIELANNANMYMLAQRAKEADASIALEFDPEEFGRDLAMQYMGSGVSWFDDHAQFPLVVPYCEVSEFSFNPDTYKGDSDA